MSLINQMLRDLEQRRGRGSQPYDVQRDIRPLPEPVARPMWPLAAGIAVLAGFALWLADRYPAADGGPSIARAPSQVPAPAAAVPVPPIVADDGGNGGLRLSFGLKAMPEERQALATAPRAASQGTPALPAQATTPAKLEPKIAQPKETTAVAKAAVSEGVIEKTAVPAAPRERAEAEYRRAQPALGAGHADEAIEALTAALRQDATHVPARQALIRLYLEGRRGEAAEAALREGLEAVPNQTGWATSLARIQVERNDLAGAQATLSRHLALGGRNADYLGFLGHVQHRLGRYPEAVASYQGAIRLAPSEGRWWLGLGLAQEADGHGSEARESFRRALATGNLAPELAAVAEQRLR